MEDIVIDDRYPGGLLLLFVDAVHPLSINIRAENWFFYYKLCDAAGHRLYDAYFSDYYFYKAESEMLIIVEFAGTSGCPEKMDYPENVISYLRVLDLKNERTAHFSHVKNGSYKIHEVDENRVIYSKIAGSVEMELEVSLPELKWQRIEEL